LTLKPQQHRKHFVISSHNMILARISVPFKSKYLVSCYLKSEHFSGALQRLVHLVHMMKSTC
jgi:hypothetical protein